MKNKLKKLQKEYERFQNATRAESYRMLIYLLIMDLFDWTLPEGIRKEFIEWNLLRFGYVAIWIDNDQYYCGFATSTERDAYNLPKIGSTLEVSTRHGEHFQKTFGVDCIVIYNNDIRIPDIWLEFYANQFAETDKSQYALIKKARLSPIPVVTSGAMKQTIQDIIDEVDSANTRVVVDDDMIRRIDNEDKARPIDTVSVTEPEEIERMQYLSKYHDDLLRRLCSLYGLPLQSASKMAQVNEKELEGYDTFAMIIPDQMMRARKDGIDFGKRYSGIHSPSTSNSANLGAFKIAERKRM